MGIKIKNLQTGEFEKFNIPALKGEKGEPGEIEPSEKVDYIGKQHSKLRDTMNANVDYIIKTAIGEFNYLDYEGQHITATNSIEGHAKSAILLGQTKYMYQGVIQDTFAHVVKFVSGQYLHPQTGQLTDGQSTHVNCDQYFGIPSGATTIVNKGNSTYKKLCLYDSDKNYIVGDGKADGGNNTSDIVRQIPSNARYFRFSTSRDTTKDERCYIYIDGVLVATSDVDIERALISCKMPVLQTVGKNLFNSNNTMDGYGFSEREVIVKDTWFISNYIEVKPNLSYIISASDNSVAGRRVNFYDKDKNFVETGRYENLIITVPNNNKIFYMRTNADLSIKSSYQIEQGTVATSYEPYKTNILYTPEEVVLRSFNGVKDTLNLMTGEYVQRIKEMVLNGNETYKSVTYTHNNTNLRFDLHLDDIKTMTHDGLLCDKLPVFTREMTPEGKHTKSYIAGHADSSRLVIVIEKSKLQSENIEGFKAWLQSNPLTIQYELKTPIVKTVDLSDNHVYSYKGTTHYSCSSEEGSLVPTLSVKVPTDTQLTIQEQKAAAQTLLVKNMDLQQSIKEVQAMNLAFNTALYNSFNSIREEVEDIKKHVSTNENLEGSF